MRLGDISPPAGAHGHDDASIEIGTHVVDQVTLEDRRCTGIAEVASLAFPESVAVFRIEAIQGPLTTEYDLLFAPGQINQQRSRPAIVLNLLLPDLLAGGLVQRHQRSAFDGGID